MFIIDMDTIKTTVQEFVSVSNSVKFTGTIMAVLMS